MTCYVIYKRYVHFFYTLTWQSSATPHQREVYAMTCMQCCLTNLFVDFALHRVLHGGSKTEGPCFMACNFRSIDQIDTKFGMLLHS